MIKLHVERVPYLYACCDALLTAEDIASSMRFQLDKRRMEHLTWRRIVRRELGRDVVISYNEVGAPIVDRPNTYISVSHGGGMVAVAIADRAIGVDVESLERDFGRVAERYMSAEEQQLSDQQHWAAMVWTAKEAMYKLYGRRGVELRDELTIESYDSSRQRLVGVLHSARRAIVDIEITDDIIIATATINDFE